ncbi:fungal-specific transcription factor domain-domain-containing protein [Leucosporidium creatinivorum]|uniref:Fungal-specific transcription factor domain-domain-containing protein n=1 Tax=Leucosporidium creatinivorum TaxID=106004 RepID=A0A1Y2FAK2_9BASI|nr:fungal-specific transcription factor domain-domain-containing protein [Leucosporidium creatinivorum]
MDQPPAPRVIRKKSRKFTRVRTACLTCKRRKKRCDQELDAEGCCQRCKIGGFTCVPNPLGGAASSSPSARPPPPPIQPPTSTATPYPPPQPPHTFPSTSEATFTTTTSQPPFPFGFGAPLPTITEAAQQPFAQAYTPIPPTSNEWTQLHPSPIPAYDPFADLSYSSTLLSLFNSLSPMQNSIFPPPQAMSSGSLPGSLAAPTSTVVSSNPSADLRAFVIRELAEGEELGDLEATRHVEEAITIYQDFDGEWLAGFNPWERPLVRDLIFKLIHSDASSRSACLAVAVNLRARFLPPDDFAKQTALKEQGKRWIQQAKQGLKDAPFDLKLLAGLDIMIHETEDKGAAAGYIVQDQLDSLVAAHPSLGPHPRPFLLGASGQTNFLLRGYACIDILRSFTLGDRRTFFDFSAPQPFPSFTLLDDVVVGSEAEFMLGVSPQLFLFAARMSSLAMDEEEGLVAPVELQARAEALETEIAGWQPADSAARANEDPLRALEAFKTREMWRHALLINLRQTLLHRGPLHPTIRRSLKHILSFGATLPPSPTHHASSPNPTSQASCFLGRALPWFIAATCAVAEQDREIVVQGHKPERAFYSCQNLPIAEKLWEITDASGNTISDWRRVLRENGLSVALM